MTAPMTRLPVMPTRSDPANFSARGDAGMTALPAMVDEFNVRLPVIDAAVQAGIDAVAAAAAAAASAASALAAPGTNATSSTALTVSAGVQSFTMQAGKDFSNGAWLMCVRTADPDGVWMLGQLRSYVKATGATVLVVAAGDTKGAGTYSDWTVSQSSARSTVFNAVDLSLVGPSIRPTLLLDFANTKRLDARLVYSMPSPLTYTDAAGVVRYSNPNVPCFDHDLATGKCLGIPLFEARTNRLSYSDDFSQGGWIGAGPVWYTRSRVSEIARPDQVSGQVNKFVVSATVTEPLFLRYSGLSLSSGTSYAATIYIFVPAGQAGVSSWGMTCDFNDLDGTIAFSSTTFGTWIRAGVVKTLTANRNFVDFNLSVNGGSSPSVGFYFYATMADLQDGAFITPYIPTGAGAVTRMAPTLYMPTSAFDFNPAEGTLMAMYIKAGTVGVACVAGLQKSGAGTDYIELRDGSALGGSPGSTDMLVISGNVNVVDTSGPATADNVSHIIVGAYKTNDFASTCDGTAVNADMAGTVPSGIDQLTIGAIGIGLGGDKFSGWIPKVAYWSRKLSTNNELVALGTV